MKLIDLTGQIFGELYVVGFSEVSRSGLPISVRDKTASLDRIDSGKGYEVGNVQWLHKDVNMMKRHYSTDYFKHLCRLVSINSCEVVDIGA